MDSTASLITPKRFVAEPSVLCYRNPLVRAERGACIALARRSDEISGYFGFF